MKKTVYISLVFGCTFFCSDVLYAQDSLHSKILTLPAAIQLALNNSVQLKVIEKNKQLAQQGIEINKLYRLPVISTGLDYGYISNADIWNSSFSDHQKGSIPHHYTQFSVQAAEAIFKGGEINNSIRKATLEAQIATLFMEKSTEDIKFLIGGLYLDIFRYINLRQVYINNATLAEHRLQTILSMKRQGMVTENDVLRTKLILSDLRLTIRKTDNTIEILNKQMNTVTGLPDSAMLVPDSALLKYQCPEKTLASFLEEGNVENHGLKIASGEKRVAETNIKLLKAERYPELAVFAGTNLQRPFLYTIPVPDIYYNIWLAGISVRYNISSIYQSPRKMKAGKIQLEQSGQNEILQKQNMQLDIRSHYIKYIEATDELQTLRNDLKSAEENYRITEKKYFNQLSLLVDMIDASNTKIEAETKVTNAEINTIYAYFLLLKAVGNFKL